MSDPAIPKFLSFKPKPSEADSDRQRSSSSRSTSHRNRHSDRDTKSSKYRSRNDDRSGARARDDEKLPVNTRERREKDDESARENNRKNYLQQNNSSVNSDLFVVDIRGDLQNLTYGTSNRYKVPAYRRYGSGAVLGLHPNLRIDRANSDDQAIVVKPGGSKSSKEGRPLLHKSVSRLRHRRLKVPPSDLSGLDVDYIEVSKQSDRPLSQVPKFTMHDSDLDSDFSDTQDAVRARSREVKVKTTSLTKKNQDDPEDVQAWLDLVDHQEAIALMEKPDGTLLSGSERRNVAEIRISILETALARVSDSNPGIVRLVMRFLKEGSAIWDFKTVAKKRNHFLQKFPDNFDLWLDHINHLQTNILLFTYDSCLQVFRTVFERFSSDARKISLHRLLYLFIRLTRMVQAAGYTEFSVALWQAILEFHFFPASSRDLDSFEEFWEDEVPRIGEPGALGWKEHRPGQGGAPMNQIDGGQLQSQSLAQYESFGLREAYEMDRCFLPGRALVDTDSTDPFHVVMYSDLEPFLKAMDQEFDLLSLLQAFLCFCGLPPLGVPDPEMRRFWSDPLICTQLLCLEQSNRENESNTGSFRSALAKLTKFPFNWKIYTPASLFDLSSPKRPQTPFSTWSLTVLKTLSKICTSLPFVNQLQEYTVAIDFFFNSLKSSTRFAKSLLKINPSNLRLYRAIALLNSHEEQGPEADRILEATLGMVPDISAEECSILLWNTWVWLALDKHEYDQAAARLLSISKRRPPSSEEMEHLSHLHPLDVHETENALLDGFQRTASALSLEGASTYAECFMILSYLKSSRDINGVSSAYDRLMSLLSRHDHARRSFANNLEEHIFQSHARLILIHIQVEKNCKPALVRFFFASAISKFPHNTDFLLFYMANESRFRLDDRVRTLFRNLESAPSPELNSSSKQSSLANDAIYPSLVSPALRVWSELHRHSHLGRTHHSIRSAFESALQVDPPTSSVISRLQSPFITSLSCPSSFSLWRSYLEYELTVARDQKRAKKVYMRGVQALPWHKAFLMTPFLNDTLRAALTAEELARMYRMLEEKEMRVISPIEEFAA